MSLEQDVLAVQEMFEFGGKNYTRETFSEENGIPLEEIDDVITILKQQGKIKYHTESKKVQHNKIIANALKEAKLLREATNIEEDQELDSLKRITDKREGRHVYEKVAFEFANVEQSKEFTLNAINLNLRSEVQVDIETGAYNVIVYNLTDKELDSLSLVYKANKAVRTAVHTIDQTMTKAVGVTDYTAKKIVTPIAKIGFSGLLGVGKTLLSTTTKIGSVLITETIKTSKDTIHTIKHDENITLAKAELCKTKSEIKSYLGRDKYSANTGIRIN